MIFPPLPNTLSRADDENFKAHIVIFGKDVFRSSFKIFPTITNIFPYFEYLTNRDKEIGDWCEREANNLLKITMLNFDLVFFAKNL
jgi:hypothetical protein